MADLPFVALTARHLRHQGAQFGWRVGAQERNDRVPEETQRDERDQQDEDDASNPPRPQEREDDHHQQRGQQREQPAGRALHNLEDGNATVTFDRIPQDGGRGGRTQMVEAVAEQTKPFECWRHRRGIDRFGAVVEGTVGGVPQSRKSGSVGEKIGEHRPGRHPVGPQDLDHTGHWAGGTRSQIQEHAVSGPLHGQAQPINEGPVGHGRQVG